MPIRYKDYIRKPFVVKGLEVTADNIEEVAKMVGTIHEDDEGKYILVNSRLVPNIDRVYPGYYLTKLGHFVHCYAPLVFFDQFIEKTEDVTKWLEYIEGSDEEELSST